MLLSTLTKILLVLSIASTIDDSGGVLILNRRAPLGAAVGRAEAEAAMSDRIAWVVFCTLASMIRPRREADAGDRLRRWRRGGRFQEAARLDVDALEREREDARGEGAAGIAEVHREPVSIHRDPRRALLHGEAVVERIERGVGLLPALRVARALVVQRPVRERPLIAVEIHDAEAERADREVGGQAAVSVCPPCA